jgi:hypothetical protein
MQGLVAELHTCAGGGFWNGERTCVDGEKLRVPGLVGKEGWGGEVGERQLRWDPHPSKGAKGCKMVFCHLTVDEWKIGRSVRLRIKVEIVGTKYFRGPRNEPMTLVVLNRKFSL